MTTNTCSVDSCTKKYYGKGYCEKHYQRVRKTGSPEDKTGHHVVLVDKFFKRVEKTEYCWNWTGPKRKGYGHVWVNGKTVRAHRASWMLVNGEIPDGLFVLHKCDNPSCVNPDHLYLGTHTDNMKDKVERDRCAHLDRRGELGGRSVLTNEIVLSIRADSRINKDVAEHYGVDRSTISDIRRRKSWKHI
jgi:hypothetical protein